MTRYLPPNLLALFQPRPPLDYQPPITKKKMPPYSGIHSYLQYFEDPKVSPPAPPLKLLTKEERSAIKRKEKLEREVQKIEEEIKNWDPHNNPKATDEAYKTLFVCRISHKTTEQTLKREFENYGPVKNVRLIYDLEGKPRGYAFIEFEREKDMGTAYKDADAKKIDGYRILVDVERGRTVKDWKPRRFGGGLGGTRVGGEKDNVRFSGREAPASNVGGDRFGGDRNDRGRFSGGGGRGMGGDRGRFSGGGRDDFRRGDDRRQDFRRSGGGEDLRREDSRRDERRGHEDRERRSGGERREERGHRERGDKERDGGRREERHSRGGERRDDRHEKREDGDRKRSRDDGGRDRRDDDDRTVRQRRY